LAPGSDRDVAIGCPDAARGRTADDRHDGGCAGGRQPAAARTACVPHLGFAAIRLRPGPSFPRATPLYPGEGATRLGVDQHDRGEPPLRRSEHGRLPVEWIAGMEREADAAGLLDEAGG
jgi:hypothetical protein